MAPGQNGATIQTHRSRLIKPLFSQLQKVLPQHLLSRLVGIVAASQIRLVKSLFIKFAVNRYNIDLTEAEEPNIEAYPSFNAFFTRALQAGARPISGEFCSPADGEISQLGNIERETLVQAKGVNYSVSKLLGKADVSTYASGSFITIYLSPRDYHRVHSPISGKLKTARYIPGKLFSVNQQTTLDIPDLFAINERLVLEFDTEHGDVAVIMVGAMIVAGIQPVWRSTPYPAKTFLEEAPELDVEAGDELGRFLMGSTAIIVSSKKLSFSHAPGQSLQVGQSLAD